MKRFILACTLVVIYSFTLSAQEFHYESLQQKSIPLSGTVIPGDIHKDFFPMLQPLEQPRPGGEEYNAYLNGLKKSIKPSGNEVTPMNKSNLPKAELGRNFEGNRFNPGGVPNDNHLAISNGGKIVSMVNTTVSVLDTTGALLKTWSFDAFSDTLKISVGKYDGRALYDPVADRFVVIFLAGQADSDSYAIVAFSKTNDPLKGWNLYKIPGSPLKDGTWSDFPMAGLTKDEFFLTLNAIKNNESWQAGFRQSYIWQVNKNDGYNGSALETKLYTNIKYNNKPIRNLCPIQGGSTLAGPDCWFLSNRNFDKSNDSVFGIHLAGKMNTPDTIISNQVFTSANSYGVAPNAREAFLDSLQTNDARILCGFIENGMIQFAGNSVYFPTGRAGVFHGVISNLSSAPVMAINVLGSHSADFGYPGIAYAGRGPADDDAVIVLNYTSDSVTKVNNKKVYVYPGNEAVFYKSGNYSDTVLLKKGNSIINMIQGADRWGDYTGAQAWYNHPGMVWVAATFGNQVKYNGTTYAALGTWISQLSSPLMTAGIEQPKSIISNASAYPVPVLAYLPLTIDFTLAEPALLSFTLYDIQGRLVHTLLQTRADEGHNRFTFNINALAKGEYFLRILSNEGMVLTKKVVVQ